MKHEAHEDAIERARQDLVSAPDPQAKRVAASHFVNLCRSRDPWLIAKLERERMARAQR